ncbi:MAG: hypothetical protein QHG94_06770, partial [Candidatus Methanosuratincola sp.]|nr:hypothetical protein [Candidatus Methanosuratincola sp.]
REGADAILLISSILGREGLARLLSACASEGLEPLVEVHTTSEMGVANSLGAPLIGINNRDIRRLETDGGDVGNTEALARLAHPGAVLVSESSIATRGEVLRAIGAGADAVLVGTAVMRAEDPGEKVRELIGR